MASSVPSSTHDQGRLATGVDGRDAVTEQEAARGGRGRSACVSSVERREQLGHSDESATSVSPSGTPIGSSPVMGSLGNNSQVLTTVRSPTTSPLQKPDDMHDMQTEVTVITQDESTAGLHSAEPSEPSHSTHSTGSTRFGSPGGSAVSADSPRMLHLPTYRVRSSSMSCMQDLEVIDLNKQRVPKEGVTAPVSSEDDRGCMSALPACQPRVSNTGTAVSLDGAFAASEGVSENDQATTGIAGRTTSRQELQSKQGSWNSSAASTAPSNPLSVSSDSRRRLQGAGEPGDPLAVRISLPRSEATQPIAVEVSELMEVVDLQGSSSLRPEQQQQQVGSESASLGSTLLNSSGALLSASGSGGGGTPVSVQGRLNSKKFKLGSKSRLHHASQESIYELAGQAEGPAEDSWGDGVADPLDGDAGRANPAAESLSVNPNELRELVHSNKVVEHLCDEGVTARHRRRMESHSGFRLIYAFFLRPMGALTKLVVTVSPLVVVSAVVMFVALFNDLPAGSDTHFTRLIEPGVAPHNASTLDMPPALPHQKELNCDVVLTVVTTVASLCASVWMLRLVKESVRFKRSCIDVELERKLDLERSALRFAPTEFLGILQEKGSVLQPGDHMTLDTAVLFSDIRDFTKISQAMDTVKSFDWISIFAQQMAPVIRQNGGFVHKYLGDGIMAIFKDANDAVQGGTQMQLTVDELNQTAKEGYRKIVMGVGVHWGAVTFGTFGDDSRVETVLFGQAATIADLTEDMTKTYGCRVLLTDATYARLTPATLTHVRRVGLVRFKHTDHPTALFDAFGADAPNVIEYKQLIASKFDTALEAHLRGEFVRAKQLFSECLETGGSTPEAPLDTAVAVRIFFAWEKENHPPDSSWVGEDDW